MVASVRQKSQFARDFKGVWVNAVKMKTQRGVRYFCDCPDKHVMKLVKPLGLGKRPFRPFFSRVSKHHKGSKYLTCSGGGESNEHKNAKHKLREMSGKFSFALIECPRCACKTMENCCDGVIEMELVSKDRKWRYDCMFIRNGVPAVALEVVKTHFSSDAKLEQTRENGIEIAEFRSEDIMALEPGGVLENIRTRAVMCQKCRLEWERELEMRRVADRLRRDREREELEKQLVVDQLLRELEEDEMIVRAAEMEWAARNAEVLAIKKHMKKCWDEEILAVLRWDDIIADEYEKIYERRIAPERARQKYITDWMEACWDMEIYLMGKQDREWGVTFDHIHSDKYRIWLETWGTAPLTVITYYA